ncbi:hypothetical protein [Methanobrevibacter sp.]|uniref:hypothetical protein n=1 Tax=Methanobrevibacter sp. TaxID=66852 RepID=UPI00386991CD
MKKINISINEDLLERIDKFSENNYLSRSGLISLACSQFLLTQETEALFRNMNIALQKIAENGIVDDKTQKELDDCLRLCSLLQGK